MAKDKLLVIDCGCDPRLERVEVSFEEETSVTIEHKLGVRNLFTVYDSGNNLLSPSVVDDGMSATIDFGPDGESGTIQYFVIK